MVDIEAQGRASVRSLAREGDYGRALDGTQFRRSEILRNAGMLIETGDFSRALDNTRALLKARNIEVRPIQEPFTGQGSLIEENGQKVMRVPEELASQHPAFMLYLLLHRRMGLLLRQGGQRHNPESLKQLFAMDRAYAEAIRLGARKSTDDYDEIIGIAYHIEGEVRDGLERIARGELD